MEMQRGEEKRDSLGNALVTGVMKDMGTVLTNLHSSEILWMEQHNQIEYSFKPGGLNRSGKGDTALWEPGFRLGNTTPKT